MTETQRRIRAYKRALPELRERVVAVALLLAMSASMLASASFAWVTLSTSPEVTGMATTVAANGNLEIALASGSMWDENGALAKAVEPGESQVGDSSAKEGNTIQGANTTWGNLVNISYGYGLDQIALRPALLSGYNKDTTPLSGAAYGQDGRVIDTNEKYEFASWGVDTQTGNEKLLAGDKTEYGVRAVTSVTYDISSSEQDALKQSFLDEAESYYRQAADHYAQLVSDGNDGKPTPMELVEGTGKTCISALEALVTVFAQDTVNRMLDSNAAYSDCGEHLVYVYRMMEELQVVLEYEGKALMTLANYQAYTKNTTGYDTKTFTDLSQFLTQSTASLKKINVELATFAGFQSNWNTLQTCMKGMAPLVEKAKTEAVTWPSVQSYITPLVDINSTTIDGAAIGSLGMSDVGSLLGSGTKTVIITKGVLKEIDERVIPNNKAYRLNASVQIKVKYGITVTINGKVYTSAWGNDATYTKDISTTAGSESKVLGPATAKDTYGLALDLWLRTNYPNAVLTLEGAVEYQETPVTITVPVRNEDGTESAEDTETLPLYTTTIKIAKNDSEGNDSETSESEIQVYQQNGKWYHADTREEITLTGKTTPVVEKTAIGYHGENRIWEDWQTKLDAGLIAEDSTTQGAGSCFVFYADTPTEQQKIKEMLAAFTVVFMDDEGNVLGTAELDVGNSIAVNGKVTVPMQMLTGTEFTDESGTTQIGITQLTQNEATYITALVYLNGSQLENENVLASGELTGQLNIQFGTSGTLVVKDDEELMGQYRTITAEVAVNGQTITDSASTELEYVEGGHAATVTLTVDGDQPDHITGFFLRKISSTQGTRDTEMKFTKQEDGTWTATTTLTNPGNYIFNTLLVDGVEYTLAQDNQPEITIAGLNLTVQTNMTAAQIMTADGSYPVEVTATIDTQIAVEQVTAQFFSTDDTKQYTAILSREGNSNQWIGTANITSSDTYMLKYVTVNGQTYAVSNQTQFTLYLGLSARVNKLGAYPEQWNTKDVSDGQSVQLKMKVDILDNSKNAIENLTGIELYYNGINDPAEMTWDAEEGYYTGVLDATGSGIFSFKMIKLGNYGYLNSSLNEPPEFRAISPEPPSYSRNTVAEKQTIVGTSKTATMQVITVNGGAAIGWAEVEQVVNGTTVTHVLKNTIDTSENPDHFSFNLTGGDGVYTLKKLYFQNVYDADENFYKEEEPVTADNSYVIDVSKENIQTNVIASVVSKVTYNNVEQTQNGVFTFGDRNNTPFMTSQKTGSLSVVLTDYQGEAIEGLTEVNWHFSEPKDMESHGGYTAETVKDDQKSLTRNSDTLFTIDSVDITQAGQYSTTLRAVVNGTTMDLPWKATFDVYSKTPTVKITGISPTGTFDVDKTGAGSGHTDNGATASFTDTTANVYIKCEENKGQMLFVKWDYHNFTQPSVTMTVSYMGNATEAELAFDSTYVYEGTVSTGSFAWTKDGTCARNIGYVKSKTSATDEKTPAGTITANQLVLTHNGVKYTFSIPTITINNPY